MDWIIIKKTKQDQNSNLDFVNDPSFQGLNSHSALLIKKEKDKKCTHWVLFTKCRNKLLCYKGW